MTKEEFIYIAENPDKIGKEHLPDLQNFMQEYPYVQIFHLLYQKGLFNMQDIRYDSELRITSLYASDRKKLYKLMSALPEKQEEPDNKTATLKKATDISSLYAPVVEIQSLLSEDNKDEDAEPIQGNKSDLGIKKKPLKRQSLIDEFIEASEKSDISISLKNEPKEVVQAQEDVKISESDDFFTETLAKIYIKQHKFENAIKIFKRLSLKYPEKSVYFADQIRFFEKLIQNL
jgi:hypothetical protein